MNHTIKSRRDFLKAAGIIGSSLIIPFHVLAGGKRLQLNDDSIIFAPNAFLTIKPDNTVEVILAHVEMGQGIWTTLPMLIADELDCNWEDIKVTHSPASPLYNNAEFPVQITGGSSTTRTEFDRYRKAGATARILLVQAAAGKMNVAVDGCKTENSFIISGNKKISYGEVAAAAARLTPPLEVELRPAKAWKYIGKGAKRLDAAAKTNGTAKFGMDMQFPGMKTAVVAHSPVFGGKVKAFNSVEALKVPGVRKVVQIPTGVAVIADHFWAAKQGRNALKVTWDDGIGANLNTNTQEAKYKKLAAANGVEVSKKGNVATALSQSAATVEGEFVFPYLAHAPMEPLNCTVRINSNSCDIWTGTQLPGVDQAAAANILGIKPENINIVTPFLGGGFGRRATTTSDFVSEAVHIAKASGEFIKMVWTREDDMKGGYYRPLFIHNVKAGIGKDGYPNAWQHNIAGQSIIAGTPFENPTAKFDDSSVEGVNNSPYLEAINDHFIGLHSPKEVVPVLWYRSVGNTHTAYAMEVMIDQLAHAAKKDPVEYRRMLLKNASRHLAALNLAAEKAGWGKKLPEGHYRGVAVHESFGSYVAQVVEISMENEKPKVHKVTCAIDCGLAVNPDGVVAQMEGGIVFGITMALYGGLTLKNGQLEQSNFYDYKIARMHESPAIDVHIVQGGEKMGGVGEPGVPPTAPALANAIFAATGKVHYRLPMLPGTFSKA